MLKLIASRNTEKKSRLYFITAGIMFICLLCMFSTAWAAASTTISASEDNIIDSSFDHDPDGFTYTDNTFKNAHNPQYATGNYTSQNGHPGGGLRVIIGGINDADITDGMSGGWLKPFNVTSAQTAQVSLNYRMITHQYDSDECGEVLVSVNGELVGPDNQQYLARKCGIGDTGWRTAAFKAQLIKGKNKIIIGGYNNKKTGKKEVTEIFIDNVSMVAVNAENIKKLSDDDGLHQQISDGQVVWESCEDRWKSYPPVNCKVYFWDSETVQQLSSDEFSYGYLNPRIDNGQVVWEDNNGNEIYFWDGETVQQLTDNETDNDYESAEPQIDNGQVIWTGYDGNNSEIFFWDGETVQQLTDNDYRDSGPRIDNGQVVWMGDDGNDDEIFFWDGETVQQLTDNDSEDSMPQIDNGQVVWMGDDGNDDEIFFWDGETVQQLTDNDSEDSMPQIDNGQVVWMGDDGNDDEIFFWDGETVQQLTDNDYRDSGPRINNGQVVWMGYDSEIFFWDGEKIKRLTNNDHCDYAPQIDNGQVVWTGDFVGGGTYFWEPRDSGLSGGLQR